MPALPVGGPEGDRTLDLRVANAALSQLSYEPVLTLDYYSTDSLNCQDPFARMRGMESEKRNCGYPHHRLGAVSHF